jgi:hypothetical protein
MIKPLWLAAACLLGGAGAGQAAENALVAVRVGECPFTLAFPGPPRVSNEKTKLLPSSVDRAMDLAFEYAGKAAFAASCGCSGTQDFGDITESEARQTLEESVGKADTKLLRSLQGRSGARQDARLGRRGALVLRQAPS